MTNTDIPCGRCDVGIYCYSAAMTSLAHALVAKPKGERIPPRCKSMDRACVGACDFIDAINSDMPGWEALKAEAA